MATRGPAPHKPTASARKRVQLLVAGGISEPVIAERLGISQNTLRKHYSDDLKTGRETAIAENLEWLRKAASRGNVTAMKYLDTRMAAPASGSGAPEGKKMAQREAAKHPDETTAMGALMAERAADLSKLN